MERHCAEAKTDAASYLYEENGADSLGRPITVKEGLLKEKWDFITVQQVSGDSGRFDTYYPYLGELIAYIKKYSKAEIVFHQTWAYEWGSTHPAFPLYGNDTDKMWEKIKEASSLAAKREGLRLIPVGEMIAALRKTPIFDSRNGGLNITRDGFHLSLNYGRFAAALVWCRFFTGQIPPLREAASEPFRTIYNTFYGQIQEKIGGIGNL